MKANGLTGLKLKARQKLIIPDADEMIVMVPETPVTEQPSEETELISVKADTTVAATAEKCGFSSSSYFIKIFSKITNTTPLKFQMQQTFNLE